jgi:hypothetical protein
MANEELDNKVDKKIDNQEEPKACPVLSEEEAYQLMLGGKCEKCSES